MLTSLGQTGLGLGLNLSMPELGPNKTLGPNSAQPRIRLAQPNCFSGQTCWASGQPGPIDSLKLERLYEEKEKELEKNTV